MQNRLHVGMKLHNVVFIISLVVGEEYKKIAKHISFPNNNTLKQLLVLAYPSIRKNFFLILK
jgi:hypothetical protein